METNYFSGTGVLLKVNITDSAGTDWATVGGQRGLAVDSSGNVIDLSHKGTGRVKSVIVGRLTKTITLDGLVAVIDNAQTELEDAHENGTEVQLAEYKDGVILKTTTAVVTDVKKNYPDEAESTLTVSLQQIAVWTSA